MGKGLIWSHLIFKVGLKLIQKMNNYDGFDYFYFEMQYTSCIIETLSGGIIHYIIQKVMIIWFLDREENNGGFSTFMILCLGH